MQKPEKNGKIIARDGWILCPVCGRKKILQISPSTVARELPLYCRRCGATTKVNIAALEVEITDTAPESLSHRA